MAKIRVVIQKPLVGTGGGAVDSVNGETGVVVLDTSNIAETTDKNYVTDSEKVVIGNTSGTNTGDETTATIQSKRPLKTLNSKSLEGTGNEILDGADIPLLPGTTTPTVTGAIADLDGSVTLLENNKADQSDLDLTNTQVLNNLASINSLTQGQTGGLISFTTLAILQAYTDLGNNDSYKVTNDSTASNNGYYHWSGSVYIKDSSLANGKIEIANTEAVEGGKIQNELYGKGILYTRKNILSTAPQTLLVGFRQDGAGNLVSTTLNYCATGFVLLEQGKTYTILGARAYSGGIPRGGLYLNIGDTNGDSVTFTPSGDNYSFTVGSNETMLYFSSDVFTTANGNDIVANDVMLEEGVSISEYEDYKESLDDVYTTEKYVNEQISQAPLVEKTNILNTPLYTGVDERLPNFFSKWKKREQDLNVIVYGDSLSVRTTNNSQFPNPEHRPPLCQGQNWASAVWDRLKWGKDLFYRFDANGLDTNPRFTELSAFVTVEPNQFDTPSQGIDSSSWDDFVRREGITRMYSGTDNASLTFSMINSTADKEGSLDFIYRTDLEGSATNTVTIAEGNGLLVVWNGSTFVEANNFVFSMKHDPVSTYRGNTKYQERLICKAVNDTIDSRNSPKTITITKTDSSDSRFMYWGIQTSTERYVSRIISSGRGGLELDTLLPFIDDDVYDHSPDLIVHEIPINGGINNPGSTETPQFYVDEVNTWFFDLGNPQSMKSRSNSWVDFECAIWSPHTTTPAFFDDNSFKTAKKSDLQWSGIQDNWRHISLHMRDSKENGFFYVEMFERWLEESFAIFGSNKAGFETSTITSEDSFLMDGTHMNDLGVKIMNKHINSIFK